MYFANGSEGDYWYERCCQKCVHDGGDDSCPIRYVHYIYNYDQAKDTLESRAIKLILNTLWPEGQDCSLFCDKGDDE